MWENMCTHHGSQLKIVTDLKSLDIAHTPMETTKHHHDRTVQLWNVLQEWHPHFEKLMIHQKQYIQALNSWLKLNLIPIESSLKQKISSPPRVQRPPIQALLHSWHDSLEKLSDELAKCAISSFAAEEGGMRSSPETLYPDNYMMGGVTPPDYEDEEDNACSENK
ncbi:protein ALTERED PHOSPHATE STARVATION RESPONSE 1-like [Malus domestica]|uniref:protein ALTERED PHOSPHATE STARVATION RESPONSE 1-like n=1 Tax=Malus domestica TaxID=3750 RepID=UPI003975B9D8